ncbi:unnamed protein product [Amoebophrya sp. A120]|nr:unnamed protein product [Amoebophrya sp. A120]|eukprot:GSA120T00006036001.1
MTDQHRARFLAAEKQDGVRFSWNIWPSSRIDATRIVMPLACLYTPLKKTDQLRVVNYDPLNCRKCGAVINPYAVLDYRRKTWRCCFCDSENAFPGFYAERLSEQSLPLECQLSTIEYILPNQRSNPPLFLFVLDRALNNAEDELEFEKAKDALQEVFTLLPPTALVGFITFGHLVQVFELRFEDLPKSYAFSGAKPYTAAQVSRQLFLRRDYYGSTSGGYGGHNSSGQNDRFASSSSAGVGGGPTTTTYSTPDSRFVAPAQECDFIFRSILDDLTPDRFPRDGPSARVNRCTGAAISVAVSLAENLSALVCGTRIVLLTSGPCTVGPGQVVVKNKAECLRSWHDIQKNNTNAQPCKAATRFYAEELAPRCARDGIALDLFACSLDQVGILEMRSLCETTGGMLVMSDAFSMHVFRDSFLRMFINLDPASNAEVHRNSGRNARITCTASKQVKLAGVVGGCKSLQKRHACVSEMEEIGEAQTNEWAAAVLDEDSSFCFFLDKTLNEASEQIEVPHQGGAGTNFQVGYLQFRTFYTDLQQQKRVRVTTLARGFADPSLSDIATGFDDEAATVVLARYAVSLLDQTAFYGETDEILRKIDRILIRLMSRFAQYNKHEFESFQLPEEFTSFPQFVYNLRRSAFLNFFNCSPDETAFYRAQLRQQTCQNSLLMIQPTLVSYGFDCLYGRSVLLDSTSLDKKVILLLDTFFHVVLWRGETIQQWFEAKYHEMLPEYQNFKDLLEQPARDALLLLKQRPLVPKFVQTYANGSQARFLVNRVNPSSASGAGGAGMGGIVPEQATVLTEDVGMRGFMESLIKYCVESEAS